jgi:hypothetical protein
MNIGRDAPSPVTNDYQTPFPFSGTIHRLQVELRPPQSRQDERKDAAIRHQTEMARQ